MALEVAVSRLLNPFVQPLSFHFPQSSVLPRENNLALSRTAIRIEDRSPFLLYCRSAPAFCAVFALAPHPSPEKRKRSFFPFRFLYDVPLATRWISSSGRVPPTHLFYKLATGVIRVRSIFHPIRSIQEGGVMSLLGQRGRAQFVCGSALLSP